MSFFGGGAKAAPPQSTGGVLPAKGDLPGPDVCARHWSTKVHSWRGKYARIWCVTPTAVHHVDADTMRITNSWHWSDIIEWVPAATGPADFTFTAREPGKKPEVFRFIADYRSSLLCDLQRYSTGGDRDEKARRFTAVKITRASVRSEVALEVGSWYLSVLDPSGRRQSLYPFKEITSIRPLREDASAVAIYLHGRARLFALPERSEALKLLSLALTRLGLPSIISTEPIATTDQRGERISHGNEQGVPRLGEYDVLKVTPRLSAPRPRKLVLTETSLTERDATTYAVVSSRPLSSVFNVVRHWDEPSRLSIEYRDGTCRVYLTSLRDALLGSLLDAARNAGNEHVGVSGEATRSGDRSLPLTLDEDATVEAAHLAALTRAAKPGGHTGGPYNAALVRAAAELNANTSPLGLAYVTKRALVQNVMPEVATATLSALQMAEMPSVHTVTLLNTLTRLTSTQTGYKLLCTLGECTPILLFSLRHVDDGVSYAGFELLRRLLHNPRRPLDVDEDAEAATKKLVLTTDVRVAMIHALDMHSSGGGSGPAVGGGAAAAAAKGGATPAPSGGGMTVAGNEGTLVVMSIVMCLDSALVSHVDTTQSDAWEHLMQLTASRYSALLSLFRCKCSGVVESATLLMRTIVEQADLGTCRAMQAVAISSGVWLRHFFNAAFATSPDQRYVSRYLVELWSTGNVTAREVLRHMLPAGVLLYLEVPKLKAEEAAHMAAVEQAVGGNAASAPASASAANAAAAAAQAAQSRGLAGRLRSRIELAEKASHNRVKRRLAALDEHAAGAKRGFWRSNADKAEAAAAAVNMAAAAAAVVAAQAAMTKAKIEGEGGHEENYSVLFFQMTQDHMMPDLIWNQQTRGELRASLEAELREIEREIELGGAVSTGSSGALTNKAAAAAAAAASSATTAAPADGSEGSVDATAAAAAATAAVVAAGAPSAQQHIVTGGGDVILRVSWNNSEFEVEYPSLVQELRVGDYYLRLFLEAGDASVSTLRDPERFFDALYRRVLRETAPNLKCMCLRGMTRVFEKHWRTIGVFDDTDYMVYLLAQTQHAEVRDRLLLLLNALSLHPQNCEKMINPDCLELLVDLLTTAHTADNEMRALPTLKANSGAALLLTDAAAGSMPSPAAAAAGPSDPADAAANANPKESLKVWHYRAKKADLGAGEKAEKGPYSLQDLQRLGDMKKLFPDSLVWAVGMREWVRLDSLRAIMWYTVSEGLPALTATARGEAACDLLRALVRLRPAVDAEGAPVRPVPRAKRALCGARTLPHIAQALLAGSPRLVDSVAGLVCDLVLHNPKALVKLYTTGIFFFGLCYSGSNWAALSQLLSISHLAQSFHSDAASLASETSLGKRSILGPILPESLICVLANGGSDAFTEAFLSNLDTPEVIWKYSMRAHLLDMIGQHLGNLPAQLSANPCTLYEYCPLPPIKYEELESELWCHNFYLNNLCDEARFPDWAIAEPVSLLRGVLDAWRTEVQKTGNKGVSTDEAFNLLGLPPGSDEREIRKAYRKLAMKFHPDKNPAGREHFEKVHKAYDTLTTARPGGVGGGSGGPDPHSILLMVRTQCILFARHGKTLKGYKYAGYPLLLSSIAGLREETQLGGERGAYVEALTRLVYLTCLATPKNAEELVREGGSEALAWLMSRLVPVALGSGSGTPLPPDAIELRIMDNVLHTLSGLATIKEARERLAPKTEFPGHLVSCLTLVGAAKVMQHTLDTISRLSIAPNFQESLVRAGVLYRLMPLLFRYDATFEERDAVPAAAAAARAAADNASVNAAAVHTDNEQRAANQQAKLAVRALARLGGYLESPESATPVNKPVRRSLSAMLTPPLAKRLSRPSPEALLRVLNSMEESALVVWTSPMRKELLAFLGAALEYLARSGGVADMGPAEKLTYTALREELRVAGVFVRFYIMDPSFAPEDPYALVLGLLQHAAFSRVGGAVDVPADVAAALDAAADEEGPPYAYMTVPSDTGRRHLRLALRALHLVLVNCGGTEAAVAKEGAAYLRPLFLLLESEGVGATTHAVDASDGSELMHTSGSQSTNKGAAGSGASAGAGGARSTPAPPTASLRELVLTSIAAFAPNEACAGIVATQRLIPVLIRAMHADASAFGPILRTFFAHSAVIAEAARVGALLDLALIFAGGPATGPAPKPGSVKGHAQPTTIAKGVRAAASALLSLMTSDSNYGPALLMNLSQLMPEALSLGVKESISGSTGAGAGSSGLMLGAGAGVGAAGAGGGSGSLGDVVTAFDTDHETPELIWNATCRHELRCALGELVTGLNGLRKRAAAAGAVGGADGCGWTLPATFRVRFSTSEGELRCGGVYVRLFLKEPTYPLRDAKGFLEALVRRFLQECEQLCGMTSDDAEKVRAAQTAAAEAAHLEEAAGGVGMKTRAEGEQSLVVRGEDVLTQLTHGVVCVLRVRSVLAEVVVQLGYVPKVVAITGASVGKPARYSMGIQCVRVMQVLASSRPCVVALGKAGVVGVLLRMLGPPLPRDTAFFLEALKLMLETDTGVEGGQHPLVASAISSDAVTLLVSILEKEKLDNLVDASAAKVHAVAILKILENDTLHGPSAAAALQGAHGPAWEKYRHQKHDLFLSRNDTRDYFLTDAASSAPAFMLKNTAEWGSEQRDAYGSGAAAAPPPSEAPPIYASYMAGAASPAATGPPPAPTTDLPSRGFNLPGFQAPQAEAAPAPAPASVASSNPFAAGGGDLFGGAQAVAPAKPTTADPFLDLLG